MARIFITGSTDGLGLAAAQSLIADGHDIVLHARTTERRAALGEFAERAAGVAIGDLSRAEDVRRIAGQVDAIGRMDAVIHNAGVYNAPARGSTPEGHAVTLAVNLLAPYMLTALMQRPDRLVAMSSGLHRGGGDGALDDIDWTARRWDAGRAYGESKLYIVALAFALARRWPEVLSNAVDPGWVRTKMGGASAPVDIATGAATQAWLAGSDDPAAKVSGRYWHHMRQEEPAASAMDEGVQDRLLARLAELTGVELA
ncbi:SDR family NAD(P)-dependent oxidoreductase [Sphingomonas crusticola]|uniref:SDR family NAD(P)-dependent oxidoreductase n=1 Tax=Sphingomonas crusticola TaxID=1697973 RepID=UPI000E2443F9|nr:SDR family NAD(P)-dependent oxidoreductase [Sphingomonas crusticola]